MWMTYSIESSSYEDILSSFLHSISVRSSDVLVRQEPWPSLAQTRAGCLIDTKPLSEPMLAYYKMDPGEQFSVKFESNYINHFQKPAL